MDTLHAWLTLHLTEGLGPGTCRKLVSHFGGPEEVLAADERELLHVKGVGEKIASALRRRPSPETVEQEAETAWESGISLIPWDSAAYPQLLKEIHNPPTMLYVRGKSAALCKAGVALVGSRAASTYGRRIAESMARSLAGYGITVISGMAHGIDSAAHHGALSGGGETIAVLGCGVDVVYPQQNKKLYDEIAEGGAVVSEYPLGTQPENYRFPARNRIISGLSLGVVVVEAATRSGSLITAEMALEQGREVFAVPGRIDSVKSAGCHRILQEGAKLVHSVADIVNELPLHMNTGNTARCEMKKGPAPALRMEEEHVLSCLDVYPQNIEDIIGATGLPAPTVNQALLHLELHGLIEVLPGRQYLKVESIYGVA